MSASAELLVSSAKEFVFSSALAHFVCLLAGFTRTLLSQFSSDFQWKLARGPQKKPLDFCVNPDDVMIRVGLDVVR